MAEVSYLTDPSVVSAQLASTEQHANAHKNGKYFVPVAAAAAVAPLAGVTATDTVGAAPNIASSSKAVVNADAPALPNPPGKKAHPAEVHEAVAGSSFFTDGGDMLYEAIDASTKARNNDIQNARDTEAVQGGIEVTAKKQEESDKSEQISGERASSVTKLFGELAGTGLGLGLNIKGTRMESSGTQADSDVAKAESSAAKDVEEQATKSAGNAGDIQIKRLSQSKESAENEAAGKTPTGGEKQDPAEDGVTDRKTAEHKIEKKKGNSNFANQAAWGSGLRVAAQSAAGLVTSFTDVIDRTMGGQKQADMASLKQINDQIQAKVAGNNKDISKTWLTAATDARKALQAIILSHVELETSALSKL